MSRKQKLELTWVGKDERPRLEPRILIEDPALSYHAAARVTADDRFDNMLIQGDNLLALKALEQEFAGKVKCIYIDPPYNTGSAFEHYDDGLEHSQWLTLMHARLLLLWRLLSDTGSFWISIDDDEMPYLRLLLDEVCGRKNFIAQNVWQKRYSRENREAIGDVHEYVIVYAKDPANFKRTRNKIGLTNEQARVYRNPNNDPRGRWRPIPMTAQEGHATAEQYYEIAAPSGRVFTPPTGRCWGLARATFERLRTEGRIWFGRDGNSQPNVIRYLSEVEGVVPWTWWPSAEVGHTDEAKKEIHALFGRQDAFATPKPERLIERILQIASNPSDLVLDSFLGSGTTAAVAQKLGRRWIGIELGEHAVTHCAPRIKKVIQGEDPGGVTESANWRGGGGFRFYRLAPSLLEKDQWGNWVISREYNSAMLAEAMCKIEGFRYEPSTEAFWQHGRSTERDFIYVTTQTLSASQLEWLNEEVGADRSLLVLCSAWMGTASSWPNLTLKKIPNAALGRCEFGRDDYSLQIANLPDAPAATEPATPDAESPPAPRRTRGRARAADPAQESLLDGESGA
jgi:adenine-specific DNA-methyltransferase